MLNPTRALETSAPHDVPIYCSNLAFPSLDSNTQPTASTGTFDKLSAHKILHICDSFLKTLKSCEKDPIMPEPETLDMMQDSTPQRIYVDIRRAERSDIDGMLSVFNQAFQLENPRLAQLMYTEDDSGDALRFVVKCILETHLDSQNYRFMVAYDVADGQEDESEDPESEDSESDTDNLDHLTFGWISLGVATYGANRVTYAASDLTAYACSTVLTERARVGAVNHLSMSDPRVRLLYELGLRSKDGQARYITDPHLVVNGLVLWPGGHQDTDWEMAFKLLGRAVSFAERLDLPIWTQIPRNQAVYFRQARFTEVQTFILNLNNYAPRGSTDDCGTQEWVQMIHPALGERRARSSSPGDGGRRRRRLSF